MSGTTYSSLHSTHGDTSETYQVAQLEVSTTSTKPRKQITRPGESFIAFDRYVVTLSTAIRIERRSSRCAPLTSTSVSPLLGTPTPSEMLTTITPFAPRSDAVIHPLSRTFICGATPTLSTSFAREAELMCKLLRQRMYDSLTEGLETVIPRILPPMERGQVQQSIMTTPPHLLLP